MPTVRKAPSWTTFNPEDPGSWPPFRELVLVYEGSFRRIAALRSVETVTEDEDPDWAYSSVWEDEHGETEESIGYVGEVLYWHPLPDGPDA